MGSSDSSRHTKTLRRNPSPVNTEETGQGGYPRTVCPRWVGAIYATNWYGRRALIRAQILRATAAASPIPPTYYKTVSQNLSQAFADGTYLKDGPPKGDEKPAPPNPLTDPNAMDGMMAGMKTQMVMMVPQMVIMGWINFFFQGFVLSKFSILHEFGVVLITTCSQATLSTDAWIQVYASAWH